LVPGGGGSPPPTSGSSQGPPRAGVYTSQPSHALPQPGAIAVPTWTLLVQTQPLAVRWTKSGAVAAAKSDGRVVLPPPKSARLPAVRDEIPPVSKRDPR